MDKFQNYTGHRIVVYAADVTAYTILEPYGCARVDISYKKVGVTTINDVEVDLLVSYYGVTLGLPDPEEGTIYIVSRVVKLANPDRMDLFCPAVFIRSVEDNEVIGCRGFEIGRVPGGV